VSMSNLYMAKKDWPQSAKYFGKAVAMKPKDAATRRHYGMLLANAHETASDLQAAQKELEKSLELDPKSDQTKGMLKQVEGAVEALLKKESKQAPADEEAALYDDGGLLDADGDADEGGVAM